MYSPVSGAIDPIFMNANNYQLDRWKESYWERGRRCYSVELKQDLFGNWVVIRSWGSKRLSRKMEAECSSYEEAESLYDRAMKRRVSRGYRCI